MRKQKSERTGDPIEAMWEAAEAKTRDLVQRSVALGKQLAAVEAQLESADDVDVAIDLLGQCDRLRRQIKAVDIVRRTTELRDAAEITRTAQRAEGVGVARERIAKLETRLSATRNEESRRLIEQDLEEWRDHLGRLEKSQAAA